MIFHLWIIHAEHVCGMAFYLVLWSSKTLDSHLYLHICLQLASNNLNKTGENLKTFGLTGKHTVFVHAHRHTNLRNVQPDWYSYAHWLRWYVCWSSRLHIKSCCVNSSFLMAHCVCNGEASYCSCSFPASAHYQPDTEAKYQVWWSCICGGCISCDDMKTRIRSSLNTSLPFSICECYFLSGQTRC